MFPTFPDRKHFFQCQFCCQDANYDYATRPRNFSENPSICEQLQKFCEREQASTHLIFASNVSKGQILRHFQIELDHSKPLVVWTKTFDAFSECKRRFQIPLAYCDGALEIVLVYYVDYQSKTVALPMKHNWFEWLYKLDKIIMDCTGLDFRN